MRNLKLLYKESCKFEGVTAGLITQHAFDDKICFVYDRKIVKSLNRETKEVTELCVQDDVIAMEFVELNDCLCLATRSGEIIQYNLSDGQSETVGMISDGIEAMSFSPDQELVVLVSK